MTGKARRGFARLVVPGILGLGLLCGCEAAAQNDSGDDIRFRVRSAVELVVVPVTVKDRRGTLVTDLTREEFRLWENGEEQPIRYFSIDAFPLSAVILVDVGLTPSAHEAVQDWHGRHPKRARGCPGPILRTPRRSPATQFKVSEALLSVALPVAKGPGLQRWAAMGSSGVQSGEVEAGSPQDCTTMQGI